MFGFYDKITDDNEFWEYGSKFSKTHEFITKWSRLKKIDNRDHKEFLNPIYGVCFIKRDKAPTPEYFKVTKVYSLKEEFKSIYPELWKLQEDYPVLKGA